MSENNMFADEQFDFRQAGSTALPLLQIVKDWTRYFDAGSLNGCFLAF